MRAVRFHGTDKGPVVEEVPRPTLTEGQVLVEVRAAGVCGTELHFLDGLLTPATAPITLGHEVAGVVAEVAEDVETLRVGDRVAVHYFHPCGRCERCRGGDDHLCDAPLGAMAFATDGGFADYVAVPASSVVPVPDAVELVDAAPLCCSGTTALHAARVAGLRSGDTAVVYGIGGVGLSLVQVLKASGVRVIGVGRSAEKLQLARDMGADMTVDASTADVAEQVRESTDGKGADAVFELVGTSETSAAALAALGKAGALVYIGYSFDSVQVAPLSLVVPEQRILTSVGNRHAELVEALELAAQGTLRNQITTARLEEAPRVLQDLRHGRIAGRAVLVP